MGRAGGGSSVPSLSCCGSGETGSCPSSAIEVLARWLGQVLPPLDLSFPDVPGDVDLDICCEAPGVHGRWSQYRPPESDSRGLKSQFHSYWLSVSEQVLPALRVSFLTCKIHNETKSCSFQASDCAIR